MIVKKAIYGKVMREVTERISDEVYGCDQCKKEFGQDDKLEITVFYNKKRDKHKKIGGTDRHEFCSWECVAKFLPKIKTDFFVSLPTLHYDNKTDGTMVKDFINIINKK